MNRIIEYMVSDRLFKHLLTIGIPILGFIVIVFGYHGIINMDLHSLINSVWAGLLIPIMFAFRKDF